MPTNSKRAQAWLKEEEDSDRKNARVIDKLTFALPRELSPKQQWRLVRDFAEDVTQGKAPWLGAIHNKKGNDRDNPHCHLVIRDRDPKTGKRALYLSAGKSERPKLAKKGIEAMHTERMRELWEKNANIALERAGSKERIDRRSLKEQGLERVPTIHEGVKVRQMEKRGERPVSKVVNFPNSATAKSPSRLIDYTNIDNGKTRAERNAEIINLADERNRKEREMARKVPMKSSIVIDDVKGLKIADEQDKQQAREQEELRKKAMNRVFKSKAENELLKQAKATGNKQALKEAEERIIRARMIQIERREQEARNKKLEREIKDIAKRRSRSNGLDMDDF
ncbi:MAG: MobA/MobL family protein [Mariprofundaceae bacterium]|nr:MobA/MobL family protein [Mariprofundaceae bacterium]